MTVYAAQFTFHFGHTSSKRNISSFGKKTYDLSEIKHIKSKSKTYPLIQSRCICGLTNPTQHVKKHMSFWNKKHNHFQNSKHMPAYTMLYMRAYKLNTKYPHIHCGCICGIQSNRQIPAYTIWLYKRPTNKSSNSRVYNVVV